MASQFLTLVGELAGEAGSQPEPCTEQHWSTLLRGRLRLEGRNIKFVFSVLALLSRTICNTSGPAPPAGCRGSGWSSPPGRYRGGGGSDVGRRWWRLGRVALGVDSVQDGVLPDPLALFFEVVALPEIMLRLALAALYRISRKCLRFSSSTFGWSSFLDQVDMPVVV